MPPVRLFVGNLPYTVTEAELREVFSGAGTVSQVHVPVDRETGRPRGFAFVEFAERAHAEEAVRRFHNQLLQGRPMSVNEARERGSAPPPRTSGYSPRPSGPSGPSSFRPSSDRGPGWGGAPDETEMKPGRTRSPRPVGDAKKKGKAEKFERAPKGPIPVRGGGRIFAYDEDEEGSDDIPFDDIARAAPGEEGGDDAVRTAPDEERDGEE